jgi:hypothetical protein
VGLRWGLWQVPGRPPSASPVWPPGAPAWPVTLMSTVRTTASRTVVANAPAARTVGHDFMIDLGVHERALEGYDERLLPVLRREPLAGNNQSVGSATR